MAQDTLKPSPVPFEGLSNSYLQGWSIIVTFSKPVSNHSFFDIANYTLLDDICVNNSVYIFRDDRGPIIFDTLGYNWVIADTPDILATLLEKEERRNVSYMLADGESAKDGTSFGWYRRHARDFTPDA
ncbi:hypothetical protein VUR80DRAFT_1254 [Thermomyces stellatus]